MSRVFPPLPNPGNADFELIGSLTGGVFLPLDGSEEMQGILNMGGNAIRGGDYISDNWDGSDPLNLASVDSGATAGLGIDVSAGSAQFMGSVWLGGNMRLLSASATIGSIESASKSHSVTFSHTDGVTFSAAATAQVVNFATGASGVGVHVGGSAGSGVVRLLDTVGGAATEGLQVYTGAGGLIFQAINNSSGGAGVYIGDSYKLFMSDTDTDTYIDNAAAGQMNFYAGAVEMLRLVEDTTDYVLIGPDAAGDQMVRVFLDGIRLYDGTNDPTIWWGNSTWSSSRKYRIFRDDSDFDALKLLGTDSSGTERTFLHAVDLQLRSPVVRDDTTGSAASVYIDATSGRFQRSTSLLAHKTRITEKVADLADIDLRPTKHYRKDDKRWRYGLIADWLANQDPLLGEYDNDGNLNNYDTRGILAVLAAKIERLEQQLARKAP